MRKGHNWGICRKCGEDHGQPGMCGRTAWWNRHKKRKRKTVAKVQKVKKWQLITVAQEDLDEVYNSRRKAFRKALKYRSVWKRYPWFVDENGKRHFDVVKVEHNFRLRCQGCDEEIKANEQIMLFDLGIAKAVCHGR